jgi:hypothetical protein
MAGTQLEQCSELLDGCVEHKQVWKMCVCVCVCVCVC